MTPHDAIQLFTKTLENLEKWMDKADEHAKARSFDVDVLAQARLAPDQFAFVQQVQAACDQAKYAAAYLGGRPAPGLLSVHSSTGMRRGRPSTPRPRSVEALAPAGACWRGAVAGRVASPGIG